ncbi:MAG: hypothetical protein ACOX8I_06600 [Bacillota bacterium]|jgi:hypothetical protein
MSLNSRFSSIGWARRVPIQLLYFPMQVLIGLEKMIVPESIRDNGLVYPFTIGLLWRALAMGIEMIWLFSLLAVFAIYMLFTWVIRFFSRTMLAFKGY